MGWGQQGDQRFAQSVGSEHIPENGLILVSSRGTDDPACRFIEDFLRVGLGEEICQKSLHRFIKFYMAGMVFGVVAEAEQAVCGSGLFRTCAASSS